MKYGKCLVVAAVLGMTVSAGAQTTVINSGIFSWVISNPYSVGDGSEGLIAFVLSVVNTTGDPANNPQAFDSKASGFGGITAAALHQEYSPGAAISTPVNNTGIASVIDTHFLLGGVPHAFDSGTGAPQENYLTNSAEAPATGGALAAFAETSFGNQLTGTFTLTGAVGDTMDVAHIVVPNGATVSVHGQVDSTLGEKDPVDNFSFTVAVIPTPGALPLGVAGLALIRRRGRGDRMVT